MAVYGIEIKADAAKAISSSNNLARSLEDASIAAAKLKATTNAAFEKASGILKEEARLLRMTNRERRVAVQLSRIEAQSSAKFTKGQRLSLEDQLLNNRALKARADMLQSIRGPMETYRVKQAALNSLLRQGTINAKEYALANRQLQKDLGKVTGKAGGINRVLASAFTITSIVLVSRALKGMIDTYTRLQNRIRVVTNSQRELGETTNKLFDIARRTRSSFEATTTIFARLSLAAEHLGVSQGQALRFTESLNKAIIISGASSNEARYGLIQLSQALAAGALRGDELRSVLEQMPVVAGVIADKLGVTRGQLRLLGAEGKITAKVILDAFKDARTEIDERFAKTIPTLTQSFQIAGDAFMRAVGEFDAGTGASRILAKALILVADHAEILTTAVLGLVAAIGAGGLVWAIQRASAAIMGLLAVNPVLLGIAATTMAIVVAMKAFGKSAEEIHAAKEQEAWLEKQRQVDAKRNAILRIERDSFYRRSDQLKRFLADGVITEKEYARRREELIEQHLKRVENLEKNRSEIILKARESLLTELSRVSDDFAATQPGIYKVAKATAEGIKRLAGSIKGVVIEAGEAAKRLTLLEKRQKMYEKAVSTFVPKIVDNIVALQQERKFIFASADAREIGLAVLKKEREIRKELAKDGKHLEKQSAIRLRQTLEDYRRNLMVNKSLENQAALYREIKAPILELIRVSVLANKLLGKGKITPDEAATAILGTDLGSQITEAVKSAAPALKTTEQAVREAEETYNKLATAIEAIKTSTRKSDQALRRSIDLQKLDIAVKEARAKAIEKAEIPQRAFVDTLREEVKYLRMGEDAAARAKAIKDAEAKSTVKFNLIAKNQAAAEYDLYTAEVRRADALKQIQGPMQEYMKLEQTLLGLMKEGIITRQQAEKQLLGTEVGAKAYEYAQGDISEDPIAQEVEFFRKRLDLLDNYLIAKRAKNDEAYELEAEEYANHLERLENLEAAKTVKLLNDNEKFFGSLANLAKSFGDEESATYRAMFAASKAFAIAEASVYAGLAVAKALKSGQTWEQQLANMISALGVTAGVINQIAGVSAGFQTGGEFRVGGSGNADSQMVMFRASPNETVSVRTPSQQKSAESQQTQQAPNVNNEIINIVDPNLIEEALQRASSQKAIVNVISRNSSQISAILNRRGRR